MFNFLKRYHKIHEERITLEAEATERLWDWLLPYVDLRSEDRKLEIMCSFIDINQEIKERFITAIIRKFPELNKFNMESPFLKIFLEYCQKISSAQARFEATRTARISIKMGNKCIHESSRR